MNRSWKTYIQQPNLLKQIATIGQPGLFVYGTDDIRPSWPIEQVAHLIPNARLELLQGAHHHLWQILAAALKSLLGEAVDWMRRA